MNVSALPGMAASAARPPQTDTTGPASRNSRVIQELRAEDERVRAHEAAHLAAAGGLARGGATYTYQQGPDGKNYAVGGEVTLDTSPANTPAATIAKAQQIQAAALAPADPSPQDRRVAAAAAAMAAQAQRELARSKTPGPPGQLMDVTA